MILPIKFITEYEENMDVNHRNLPKCLAAEALHSHSFVDLPERRQGPGVSAAKGAAENSSEGAGLSVGAGCTPSQTFHGASVCTYIAGSNWVILKVNYGTSVGTFGMVWV